MILGIPTMFALAIPFFLLALILAFYRYLWRPRIYAGETKAKVVEIAKIYTDHARIVIRYRVSDETYEKKILSGIYSKKKKDGKRELREHTIKTEFELEEIITIRYKLSKPEKIYVKSPKISVYLIIIIALLGNALFCIIAGLILN